MMPVILGFTLWHYASGLALYWGTGNIINLIIQLAINQSQHRQRDARDRCKTSRQKSRQKSAHPPRPPLDPWIRRDGAPGG